MKKFNVNDRVYPPRVIDGVWIQVNGAGTVKEVSDDGYTVLFDWGATISGLQDNELEPVAESQEQS